MAGKKGLRALTALALAVCLIALPNVPPTAQAASNLSDLQQQQAELEKKQQQLNQTLQSVRNDKSKQQEYVNALNSQIQTVQSQIDLSNQKIAALQEQIEQKSGEIAATEKTIDEDFERLKKRLRAIYMAGESSSLDLILGAEDFNDFMNKAELIRSITEHDTALIQTLKENKANIEDEKSTIEENLAAMAEEKKSLDAKQTELASLVEESESVLAELQQEESEAAEAKRQADAEKKKIDAEIDQWWKDYYAQQQEQNKPDSPVYNGERFTWPVPGYTWLSQGYHSGHLAVDIAGSGIYGKPIVAANDGKVVYVNTSGWGYGYGIYLMIDHGGGYGTLYAHCSSLAVSVGQTVEKGQTIAYVGSTGNSTGPHLHFETRKNGVKYNPMSEFN